MRCSLCEHLLLKFCTCISCSDLYPFRLPTTLQDAHLVLWLGISFEQSASVEYFR